MHLLRVLLGSRLTKLRKFERNGSLIRALSDWGIIHFIFDEGAASDWLKGHFNKL